MEKNKTSKKALKNLINASIEESIGKLELPKLSKKAKKVIGKNAKKLADIFADSIKRDHKKKEKSAKKLTDSAVITKKKKTKKKAVGVAG